MNISFDLSCLFDGSLGYDLKKKDEYKKNLEKCIFASEKLTSEVEQKTNSIINSFELNYQKQIQIQKDKIKKKKNKLIIGLGGSSAGAKAINGYLGHDFYFFDNYDPRYLSNFLQQNDLSDFTIYVISKSGNTFETLALFNLVYQHLLQKNNSQEINKNIYFIIEENNLEDSMNPAVNAAVLLSLKEINNLNFNINLLYEYSLKNFSYWFHQLFAESLGKNNIGLTPLTSICPKDHHSMMQLYLDGPKDKFFNIYVPSDEVYFEEFAKFELGPIEKKSPEKLIKSQFLGLVQTFREKKVPFKIIQMNHQQPFRLENILELLTYNILETIILGYAQNIDPYNQPAVEQIKINTFKD